MRTSTLFTYLALFLSPGLVGLAACAEGDGVPDADVEILNEGGGATNAAPLEAFRLGRRRIDARTTTHVEGEGTIEERALIRLRTDYLDGSAMDEVSYLRHGEKGWEVHGDAVDGALERPYLLIPDRVRVGMRWRSEASGIGGHEFEVTSRQVRDTPFGELPVWTIVQYDQHDGLAQIARQYVEGYGQLPAEVAGLAAVTPMTDRELPRAPTLDDVELEALEDDADAQVRFPGRRALGLTVIAPAGGGYIVALKAEKPCASGMCPADECLTSDGEEMDTMEGYRISGDTAQGAACPMEFAADGSAMIWGDASAAAVTQRDVYWTRRAHDGSIDLDADRPVYAVWSAEARARLLRDAADGRGMATSPWRATDELDDDDDEQLALGLASLDPTGAEGRLAHGWAMDDGSGAMPAIGLVQASAVLAGSSFDGDVMIPPAVRGALPGAYTVKASQDGHEVLVTSPDGAVDRLHLDGERAELERVAMIDLDDGQSLVGAFVAEDRDGDAKLIVFTTDAEGDAVGEISAWTAELSAGERYPIAPAAIARPTAPGSLDVEVCWSPSSEALSTSGWTLAGEAAKMVIPTRTDCAVIVRDVTTAAARARDWNRPEVDFYAVEGPVPGLGRTAFAMAAPEALASPDVGDTKGVAPLAGGGGVAYDRVYAAGGLDLGRPAYALEGSGPVAIPDLGGAGLWTSGRQEDMGEDQIFLLGYASEALEVDGVDDLTPVAMFATEGGGAAFMAAQDSEIWWHATPAGVSPLPTPPGDGRYFAVRRGEACGTFESGDVVTLFCDSSAGLRTLALPAGQKVFGLLDGNPGALGWVPMDDGTYLVRIGQGDGAPLQQLDLDDFSMTDYDETSYDKYRIGADGALYAIDVVNERLKKLTANGAQTVDVVEPLFENDSPFVRGRLLDFMVFEEMITVRVARSGTCRPAECAAWLRLPTR